MITPSIIGLTPFEKPDIALALALQKAGALPILHTGHSFDEAKEAMHQISQRTRGEFGICLSDVSFIPFLPKNTSWIIVGGGIDITPLAFCRVMIQVTSLEQAVEAIERKPYGLVVKGNESGGVVGEKSTFVLFQELRKYTNLPLWVQGGIGVHSAAALIATGANGIIFDNQLALFPEAKTPKRLRDQLKSLDGSETRVFDDFRVLMRPNSPKLKKPIQAADIIPLLGAEDLEKEFIPMGQEIGLANELATQYKTISNLVDGLSEAIRGHHRQAQTLNPISIDNSLASELEITFPIAQGPMTRVSDIPEFAYEVAKGGGLPFIALSLLHGERARKLLVDTKELLEGRTWGVGILGFVPEELRKEQLKYIEEVKPPVVLIAGGRPSQAKPLENAGIETFLHVPSVGLLDAFLKEGAKRFVFEGRECGGHVGPLHSLVLWEKQIIRLLQEEDVSGIQVFFAGGIHDALSAAIVSVMAAPLVAKGASIGVLMGTAYLFTKEAVAAGAIVKAYQDRAIELSDTVLLETAPGHVTRCLKTPFVKQFQEEKERLQQQGVDKVELWKRLEELNVGRLRIAAKGIDRAGEALIEVDADTQLTSGMYMMGQVAGVIKESLSIQQLHESIAAAANEIIAKSKLEVPASHNSQPLDVAIVGMACIYPDAANLDEYWKNILTGKNCIKEVPSERWNKEYYYDPESTGGEKTPSKWGGFIPDTLFDPVEFGIPPQSLAAIDVTQLLSLKVAREALEDAGYGDKEFDRENTSVIFGLEGGGTRLTDAYGMRAIFPQLFGEMPKEVDEALPHLTEDSFPGVLPNVVSGRIANRLDFGGANYVVDAACASSLAVIDLACQELVTGKSSMVLAGGVDFHNTITDYLFFSSTKALSRKGLCSTFDAEADGITLGEGVAVVVLKKLVDAKRDGDKVYAVIKGVGASSDGKGLGLTAPRKKGQVKAMERAYRQAGISASEVNMLEAHGTGTVVGDKAELSSITDVFIQAGAVKGQTHLGSVKTQIGHTKCAAGMAGLIKMALSIYHGVKPATFNLKQPNKYYNEAFSPFVFNTEFAGLWQGEKRTAAVSAFGFGGTNYHAVLTSAASDNVTIRETEKPLSHWPYELFVFRGTTEEVQRLLRQVREIVKINDAVPLKDLAYSLAIINQEPVRLSIIASNRSDLLTKIENALQGTPCEDVYHLKPVEGRTAFLFSGQGSQRINMAREILINFPESRTLLNQATDYIDWLFPSSRFTEDSKSQLKEAIKDTRLAQPLLGLVDYGIATLLKSFGVAPDAVAGHSYGELPALCYAGVFDKELLVSLSEGRAKAILDSIEDDKGAMLAVSCNSQELLELMMDHQGVYVANHNSPHQLVVSGSTEAIEKFAQTLKERGKSFKQLEVACAFHSPLLEKSAEYFAQTLCDIPFARPTLTVWSNTSASPYPEGEGDIKQRLAEHLVKPVLFSEEVRNMYDAGVRIFIETGPGKVLSALTKNSVGEDAVVLHTEQQGVSGILGILRTLAQYTATGKVIHCEKLFEGRRAKIIDLFDTEKYRVNPIAWKVNGYVAVPLSGKMPAHGAPLREEPIALRGMMNQGVPTVQEPDKDQLLMEYFKNVNNIIQAQRDIMLTYMGAQPNIEQVSFATAKPVQEIKSAVHVVAKGGDDESTKPISPEQIRATLLEVVSEKTGYPSEMLGMDMDLEADLSIDSIKRIEIISTLKGKFNALSKINGNEDGLIEELASIKTLNRLLQWIISHSTDTEKPDHHSVEDREGSARKEISKVLDRKDIQSLLLEAVSQKTGYPTEMLGLDMDLEADLSIDSIKRVEIIGELKSRLGILQQALVGDDVVESLASIKTLNGLIDWMVSFQGGQASSLTQADRELEEENIGKIDRLAFHQVVAIAEMESPSVLKGKRFAIVDAQGIYGALLKEQMGDSTEVIAVSSPAESLSDFDGLILMDLKESQDKLTIDKLFQYVKQLDTKRVEWIYIITDSKNEAGNVGEQLNRIQGFSGFINSLSKELKARCRTINIEASSVAPEIAHIIYKEILFIDSFTEIFYTNQQRLRWDFIKRELPAGTPGITLGKDSVVLVLGGAQGITASILKVISKEYPCHYALVGRSADPFTDPTDEYSGLLDQHAIRQKLIASQNFKTPREIENQVMRIYKRNQAIDTLMCLKQNGAETSYYSVDIRQASAVNELVDTLLAKHGKIDGVIHAAGFLDDKFFAHKSYESFHHVYATKTTPLFVLAERLSEHTQFMILFSSIASAVGNKGQVDYSAANSALDAYAQAFGNKGLPRILSINWGPWKGTGMVSTALEKEYNRRGIGLIPTETGAELFLNELKYGNESQVMFMAGDPEKFSN